MPQRIVVDPALEPVRIPSRVFNEIASHARETLPEECCGLVAGTPTEPFRDVYRCRNEMTRMHERDPGRHPRDGSEAFHMHEGDYLAAAKQADARGEAVTAVYHSHPGIGVYFSELDQAYASQVVFPFPDADHIVVSIIDGRVEAGLFRRAGGGFVGRALEPAAW